MGAELLVTALATHRDATIEWDKARDWVAQSGLTIGARFRGAHYHYMLRNDEEIVDTVDRCLRVVQESIDSPWGNVASIWFRGYIIYILGDTSYGEPPDGFDEWNLIHDIAPEALYAAGFADMASDQTKETE